MLQFALISLIPGLLRKLQDAADPEFDSYEKNLIMPTSLKTSERNSRKFYSGRSGNSDLRNISAVLYGPPTTAVGNVPSFRTINSWGL